MNNDIKGQLLANFSLDKPAKASITAPHASNNEDFTVEVWIKKLTVNEAQAYQESMEGPAGEEREHQITDLADLVAMCLVDEEGKALFENAEELNSQMGLKFIEAAFRTVADVNGMQTKQPEPGEPGEGKEPPETGN